jgi:hypothetical protein
MKLRNILGFTVLTLATISTAFARPATFAECKLKERHSSVKVLGWGLNYGKEIELFKKGNGYPLTSGYDLLITGSSNPAFSKAVIGNFVINSYRDDDQSTAGSIYITDAKYKTKTIFVNKKGEVRAFAITFHPESGLGILKMYDGHRGEIKIATLECETPELDLFR